MEGAQVKRGRPLKTVEGLALRIHRVLRESGPRKLTVLRGLCAVGASEIGLHYGTTILFERVIGILFLQGKVEWVSSGRHRRLAARTG